MLSMQLMKDQWYYHHSPVIKKAEHKPASKEPGHMQDADI